MEGEEGQGGDEIGGIPADIGRLRDFSEKLARKLEAIGKESLADPEFVRRSFICICEGHAILAAGIVAVFETLEANGIEIVLPEEMPGAERPPRPHLRLVDPETS
jgi:hypothetical protein